MASIRKLFLVDEGGQQNLKLTYGHYLSQKYQNNGHNTTCQKKWKMVQESLKESKMQGLKVFKLPLLEQIKLFLHVQFHEIPFCNKFCFVDNKTVHYAHIYNTLSERLERKMSIDKILKI